MPGELRLRLLGGFGADVDGVPVPPAAWQRSSATELVKLLALQPGHRLHREQVVDLLWPDLDPASGTRRLNKALHFARRALAADQVVLRDDLVSLSADPLTVDVDDFDAAARDGDFEAALALYAGDLLPENRYDDWAEPRRTQMKVDVVRLLLDQAAAREARGDRRGATDSLQRLVEIDPLHEEAYTRLIRLAGPRHLALRWYNQLADRLRDELGVEPSAALQRLRDDLVAGVDEPEAAAVVEAEERKLVTVLAVDFRGVRPAPPDADPEQSRRDAATWTELLCEIVRRWGGTPERLAGGGVFAVFGYPSALEDHAERALWAGFEALQRIPAAVRIGADSGEIIARSPSLSDVGGEVLDGASWLRESADARTLLASERTRNAARHGDFRFGRAIRPGGQAIAARRLLSAAWATDRRPLAQTALVGRDDELRTVLSLLDEAAASRRPRLVTVVGAAGIGKSRLVHEIVAAALHHRPQTRVLRGRCLAAGDGVTYWALGEILRDACGIALGEGRRTAQQKLHAHLASVLDPSEVDRIGFALAATAAIPMRDSPLDDETPRAVADELARAWPRFISATAAGGPVIVVVEDLHWAGAPLLEMLERIAARSTGPVVLLTTARPELLEEHRGFGGASADLAILSLRSLTGASSRELLDRIPRAGDLDGALRDDLLARAEGNPYFLEELVAHIADGAPAALPDSLHALLAARVDALPAPEKRLLQSAAVVGRAFWLEPLSSSDPAALESLERRGLVVARHRSSLTGQAEYAFKHALLRDVAYASLPLAQRAHGHADIAAWLEEVARDRIGEVIELVAYHYSAAADGWDPSAARGDWVRGKALRSLLDAGASVRRRNAVDRALDHHRRALRYAVTVGERAECIEAIGDDHETAYHGDSALAAWAEGVELLRTEPRYADLRVRLCLKMAQMAVARWGGFRVPADPELGDRVIDEGLSSVVDAADRAQLLALRALCGGRWAWTGRADPVPPAERRRAAEDSRRLADSLDSPVLRSLASLGTAAAHFIEGRYDDAVTTVLDETERADRGGRNRDRALGHIVASLIVAAVHGDNDRALDHALTSYALSRDLAPHDRLHGTYFVMAALEQLGRWDEIEPYLAEHLAVLVGPEAEMSCPYIRGGPLIGALAAARRGDAARARELAAAVALDLDHPGNPEALHGLLAVELGEPATGRRLAEHLLDRDRRPGPEEVPLEAQVEVEALRALGDFDALRRFLPRAREVAAYLAVLGPTCDRAEGLMLAAHNDFAGASVLLRRALDRFTALAMPLQVERTRSALASVEG